MTTTPMATSPTNSQTPKSFLALDLGLHTLRTPTLSTPSIISLPSSTLTILPCGEHKKISNKSQLQIQRCGERGNLTNLPVLKTVLEHCFKNHYSVCILLTKLFDPSIPHLLPLLPSSKTVIAPSSSFIGSPDSTRLTVDCGFSGSYITPVDCYQSIVSGHVRCGVGGRVLTNYLREYLGYSKVKVDEWVAEMVKEKLGPGMEKIVLPDWRERQDVVGWEEFLETKRKEEEERQENENVNMQQQAPPPLSSKSNKKTAKKSSTKSKKQKIEDIDDVDLIDSDDEDDDARRSRLFRERRQRQARAKQLEEQVTVLEVSNLLPLVIEALFNPLDVLGLNEVGVAEACKVSIGRADKTLREALWNNIVVTGGSRKIPGFMERLRRELRSLAPDDVEVNVVEEEESEAVKRAEEWLKMGGSKGGFFSNVGMNGGMFDRDREKKEGGEEDVVVVAAQPEAVNVNSVAQVKVQQVRAAVAMPPPPPVRVAAAVVPAPAPVAAKAPAVKAPAVKKKTVAKKKQTPKKPQPPKPIKKEEKWFALGEKIEAQWARQKCWYPGTIVKVHGNGRYDISYADQDYESGLEWNYIRCAPKKSRSRG